MDSNIYERLKAVARAGGLITYGEIAPLANLHMENPGDRVRMAQLLGDISEHEHAAGRPLLSAVVVLAETYLPGQGFFSLAEKLGLYHGANQMDALEFYAHELRRVHDYWREAQRTRQEP